jgi:hypothetical protein
VLVQHAETQPTMSQGEGLLIPNSESASIHTFATSRPLVEHQEHVGDEEAEMHHPLEVVGLAGDEGERGGDERDCAGAAAAAPWSSAHPTRTVGESQSLSGTGNGEGGGGAHASAPQSAAV